MFYNKKATKSRPDHNFRPKKYKFFFAFIRFRTLQNVKIHTQKNLFRCTTPPPPVNLSKGLSALCLPPPPPNQPNPCVLVASLDTLIVCVIRAPVTGGPWAVILGGFKKRFRGYIQLQIWSPLYGRDHPKVQVFFFDATPNCCFKVFCSFLLRCTFNSRKPST